MEVLITLLLESLSNIKKVIGFIGKEFFFVFIYAIIGSVLTLILWVLLVYVFPNKEIYKQLLLELNNSKKIVVGFLYLASLGCIYMFRLLLAAVQGGVLK